jgi:hypothetical protein
MSRTGGRRGGLNRQAQSPPSGHGTGIYTSRQQRHMRAARGVVIGADAHKRD